MSATLYYWPIKARNVLPLLIATEGGYDLKQETPEWPAFKPNTVFGQLPHLKTADGLDVSQSAAIARFLAHESGLEAKSRVDLAVSEMLVEQYGDLLSALGKCQYAPDKAAEWDKFFAAPAGAAYAFLASFEKLLKEDGTATATRTAGELAIVGALALLKDLEPLETLLAGFPKLQKLWAARSALAEKALAGLGAYYKRPTAVLYYWPIKARNVLPLLVAAKGGVALKLETPEWPAFKPNTVFGQLPHLKTASGVEISQSGAIVRALSHAAGLEGKTPADFAVSEMLIEEYGDFLLSLGKTNGDADKAAAYEKYLGAGGGAHNHLAHFEKLLVDDGTKATSAPSTGELAILAALSIIKDVEPLDKLLAGYPKLQKFWAAHGAFADTTLAGLSAWFKRA